MIEGRRLAIVGDISDTHARFAISDVDEMTITHFAAFETRPFPSLQAAIEAYRKSIPHRPLMAGFALAAPLGTEPFELTNTDWSFTADEVAAAAGAGQVYFVNDIEAVARSLPHLNDHDLQPIGAARGDKAAAKVALGIGTGFGLCGLAGSAAGWAATPAEAGHVSFGATNARELGVLEHMAGQDEHVPLQQVLSRKGLEAIHAALGAMRGTPSQPLSASDIIKHGNADPHGIAAESLDCFITILARIAGDIALLNNARGGLYLAGDIAPRILDRLTSGDFRKAFENKGRMSGYLEQIPLRVITSNDATLRGTALALSEAFPAKAGP